MRSPLYWNKYIRESLQILMMFPPSQVNSRWCYHHIHSHIHACTHTHVHTVVAFLLPPCTKAESFINFLDSRLSLMSSWETLYNHSLLEISVIRIYSSKRFSPPADFSWYYRGVWWGAITHQSFFNLVCGVRKWAQREMLYSCPGQYLISVTSSGTKEGPILQFYNRT